MILNSGQHKTTREGPAHSCRVRSLGGRRGGSPTKQRQTHQENTKTKLSSANANHRKSNDWLPVHCQIHARGDNIVSPHPRHVAAKHKKATTTPTNTRPNMHGALKQRLATMQAGLETSISNRVPPRITRRIPKRYNDLHL